MPNDYFIDKGRGVMPPQDFDDRTLVLGMLRWIWHRMDSGGWSYGRQADSWFLEQARECFSLEEKDSGFSGVKYPQGLNFDPGELETELRKRAKGKNPPKFPEVSLTAEHLENLTHEALARVLLAALLQFYRNIPAAETTGDHWGYVPGFVRRLELCAALIALPTDRDLPPREALDREMDRRATEDINQHFQGIFNRDAREAGLPSDSD